MKRPAGRVCPDRRGELAAALDALAAVPIEYMGAVAYVNGSHPVLSTASRDALIAAASRVCGVLRAPCADPNRSGNFCDICLASRTAFHRWQMGRPVQRGEADAALGSAMFSGDWPARYVAEWQHWAGRLFVV